MMTAVCARCGEPLVRGAARCPACDGAVAGAVLGPVPVGPLASGAAPASPARRALSCAISLAAPVVVAAGMLAATLSLGVPTALLFGLLAGLVAGAIELVGWLRSGRALGGLLTSTRTVRADDGTALSWRGLAHPFSRRVRSIPAPGVIQGPLGRLFGATTVVVRGDADPFVLATRGIATLPPRIPGVVARDIHAPALTLVFDGRVRMPLVRSLVLGRNPPPVGGDTVVVSLPDMSRSISKSHVRVDRIDGRVFAQDLGSTNGTQLVEGDRTVDLRPGERVELTPGAHLLLAGLVLRVDAREGSAAA